MKLFLSLFLLSFSFSLAASSASSRTSNPEIVFLKAAVKTHLNSYAKESRQNKADQRRIEFTDRFINTTSREKLENLDQFEQLWKIFLLADPQKCLDFILDWIFTRTFTSEARPEDIKKGVLLLQKLAPLNMIRINLETDALYALPFPISWTKIQQLQYTFYFKVLSAKFSVLMAIDYKWTQEEVQAAKQTFRKRFGALVVGHPALLEYAITHTII